jgi:hypothetical protein
MFLSDYILNEGPAPDHGLKAPFFEVPPYRIVFTQLRKDDGVRTVADALLRLRLLLDNIGLIGVLE